MEEKTRQEILEKMEEIKQIVENTLDSEKKIGDIGYYEELPLDRLGILEAYEVQIIGKKIGEREEFVIYTKDNVCAAKVDSKGGVELSQEYKEQLQQTNIDYYESLNLNKDPLNVNLDDEEHREKKTMSYKAEKEKPKEAEAESKGKLPEGDNATQEIAKEKGIPAGDVLIVREDSELFKNHPKLKNDKGRRKGFNLLP